MEVIGWIALFFVGPVIVFKAALMISLLLIRGGLETFGPSIIIAVVVTVFYLIGLAYFSPLSITIS